MEASTARQIQGASEGKIRLRWCLTSQGRCWGRVVGMGQSIAGPVMSPGRTARARKSRASQVQPRKSCSNSSSRRARLGKSCGNRPVKDEAVEELWERASLERAGKSLGNGHSRASLGKSCRSGRGVDTAIVQIRHMQAMNNTKMTLISGYFLPSSVPTNAQTPQLTSFPGSMVARDSSHAPNSLDAPHVARAIHAADYGHREMVLPGSRFRCC